MSHLSSPFFSGCFFHYTNPCSFFFFQPCDRCTSSASWSTDRWEEVPRQAVIPALRKALRCSCSQQRCVTHASHRGLKRSSNRRGNSCGPSLGAPVWSFEMLALPSNCFTSRLQGSSPTIQFALLMPLVLLPLLPHG